MYVYLLYCPLMHKHSLYIIVLFLFFIAPSAIAQEYELEKEKKKAFTVRGVVKESDTDRPIKEVNIQVNGGAYTSSSISGDFKIIVNKGDELIISHKDFETVYYTIKNNERITINVEPAETSLYNSKRSSKKAKYKSFKTLLDSAIANKKVSAEKSIQFIAESIAVSTSTKQNAEAFMVLGDVYMYWKQYDLAVSNYRISLNNETTNEVNLKLANAFSKNGNYQESLSIYEDLKNEPLSNYQAIECYEGLGDVYNKVNKKKESLTAYQKGLELAHKHKISIKEVVLTSKIAETYGDLGEVSNAKTYYTNSLNLAVEENKSTAVKEKIKVADYNNKTKDYDNEIALRKEIVKDLKEIKSDTIHNESPLTVQKQNYKIGNAYYLNNNIDEAIPYFEESIKEAEKKEDLVVRKDATRKLSEVYVNVGNYEKALSAYQKYTSLVEKLNVKKEQEISRAMRNNRSIVENQNRITSLEKDRQLTISQFELSKAQNKSKTVIIYSLLGGILLLLFVAYLMYKSMKQQKLSNNLLALKSLRSQMNPHFIFNALNSVNGFIATNDERTANKYLSDFSQLMRAVLENSEEDFIPLNKEVELLELYTKLEHFRFQDKFDYTIKVDKAIAINDYQIPPMLLQPYIENAVWHGLRYKKEKGILNISINKKNHSEITITIADNGIGREKSKAMKTDNQKKHNSKGMGNIKKRVAILNEMYKDKVDVFIDDYKAEEDIGTKVVVTIRKD